MTSATARCARRTAWLTNIAAGINSQNVADPPTGSFSTMVASDRCRPIGPERLSNSCGNGAAWLPEGHLMNDGAGTGTCVVVFDTEDNAKSALTPLTPEGGPRVIGSGPGRTPAWLAPTPNRRRVTG